jgi:uncharacterized membrane protein YqjE
MDDTEQPASTRFSFQRLGDTLLNTVRNRVELLGVELEEEKQWFLSTLCWTAISLFCGFTALLVMTFTVVALVPEGARPYVLIAFCVIYLAATFVALARLRRNLKQRPAPFRDTVEELRKDITCLRGRE